jgi:hypothetical protein
MINYKLIENSNFVRKIENDIETNEFLNAENNTEYLEWLEQGNTPLPAYTEEELAKRNKSIREEEVRRLLYESDYIELPSFLERKGQEIYNVWMSYRANLRLAFHDIEIPIPEKPTN